MKICLIIPPARNTERVPERVYGCTFTYYSQPELPMLYVASILEKDKHSVEFKDFTINNSWNEFTSFVTASDFDVFIFHTVLLAESIDKKAASFILENTRARVIFYGPHPTLEPRGFLINEMSFVARGEAEFIIRDLLRAFELGGIDSVADIKGVSYLKDNEMVENKSYGIIEDLDILPFPSRHFIDDRKDDFFNPKLPERPVTLLLSSRGCSFKCNYCVPNAISWARELEWRRFHNNKKPPVRYRSPAAIVEEFKVAKRAGYKAVSVVDDLFLFGGKQRILDICRGLKGVGMPFGVLARCDMILDEDIVSALKEAGCEYVDLGVESLDQKVLDDIEKGMDVASVEKAVNLLNKYGIEPKPNIMFGSSAVETLDSLEATIDGISKLPIHYCMFSIATPFPGTEFAKRIRKNGYAVLPDIDNLEENLSPTERALVSYPELTKQNLEKAIKKANRRFYLKPERILYQIKRIGSFRALKDLLLTGWRVIR